jgi:hypothetical protein
MLRQQRPLVHRAAAPAAAAVAVGNQIPPWQIPQQQQQPGPRMQGPIPAAQGAPGPIQNLYQYIAPHLMAQGAQQQQPQKQRQQPQQQQLQQQQQPQQQQQFIQPQMYGPAADNAGYPPIGAFGFPQMAQVLGGFLGGGLGPWGQQQEGTRQPTRFPAAPLPNQPMDVQTVAWNVANCWPDLPSDRIQGIFTFSQAGELLTVRAPRDEEDWMHLNPRHDEQRWSVFNSTIAVLTASRLATDRAILDQFELLVQPIQFLEQFRRTMPMTEIQLDMLTSMHERMMRRLNALDVFDKGGQLTVNEFMKSSLTGIERSKANALYKAKKTQPQGNPNNRKRGRHSGGGPAATATSGGGGAVVQQQQQQQGG